MACCWKLALIVVDDEKLFIWHVSKWTLFNLTRSLKLIKLIGWVKSQIKFSLRFCCCCCSSFFFSSVFVAVVLSCVDLSGEYLKENE